MSFPGTAVGRLRSLQYLLFLLYFVLVFKNYFSLVSFLPSDFLATLDQSKYYLLRYLRVFLVTGTLVTTNSEVADAFIALALIVAAYGIGRKILRWCHGGFESLGEELVFGAGLGLVVLAVVAFALGILGQLHVSAIYWTLGSVLLLGSGEIVTAARKLWQAAWLAPFLKRDSSWVTHLLQLLLMAYIVVFLAVAFVACHLPETEFDPLVYHLTVPKLYLQHHGIVDIPEILEAVFPKNIGMLYVYGLVLHSQITVKFLNFWMGLLLLLGIHCFAKRFWGRPAGVMAAALFVSTPLVFFQLRSVYIDLPIAFFCFLNFFSLQRWMEDGGRKWLVVSAVFLGMAAGSKYNALFNVVAASLLVAYHFLRVRKVPWTKTAAKVAIYGLLSVSSLLAWLILTYRFTGDPLFPYLSGDPLFPFLKGLFHSSRWESYNLPVVRSGGHRWGLPLGFGNALKTLWQMHFDEKVFCGSLGPFFVLLFPLLLVVFRLHPAMKRMLAYSSIYIVLWLVTTQANRYLIPVLPIMSLLCAGLLLGFLEAKSLVQTGFRSLVTVALLVAAFYNLPFLFYLWWTPGKRYFTPVLGAFPESVFSDNYKPERYLANYLGSLPAINFVNSLGNVKTVLYVGYRDGPPLFYANFPMVYNELALYNQFLEARDLSRLLELTRRHNISHLIVEQKFGVDRLVSSPDSEFARRHLRQIWNKNAVSVFELHQNPRPRQEFEVVNYLIDRMVGSKIESSAGQAVYHPNNYRDIHRLFPEPRFCILTFDQFEVRITVQVPENAHLRFGLGFKQNTTRFPYVAQVFALDGNGRKHALFSRWLKLTERFEDQHWSEERVDLSSFAGQSVGIVFTCRATGAVEHQPYPIGVPDGIVLWSEPQILARAPGNLDLLEHPESFTMLPVAKSLMSTPNKAYAFVDAGGDARRLVVLPGGEARYDLLVPEKRRLAFRLDWQQCSGSESVVEILLETLAGPRQVFRRLLPSCEERSGQRFANEAVRLKEKEFAGISGMIVFRVLSAESPEVQRVVFSQLRLEEADD
ncbi:MAG: phospholipid carrier-dependent glycosyltransferase [Acidimicrobiia bacterium]|nr:phospholipid carrier-dependent glycosyltransferase [Acidimicrobiia bacterium]